MESDARYEELDRLLRLEFEAEGAAARAALEELRPREAAERGISLLRLQVMDEEPVFGGRYQTHLQRAPEDLGVWTRIRSGAPVRIRAGAEEVFGIVARLVADSVAVVTDDGLPESFWGVPLRVDALDDGHLIERQRRALAEVRTARKTTLELRRIVDGAATPRVAKSGRPAPDEGLNSAQQRAVDIAMTAHPIALIHGPPGTGKTQTVAHAIRCAVQQGQSVLACAPSNLAVDGLTERLAALKLSVVRLGHPARLSEPVRVHSLTHQLSVHPDGKRVRRLRQDAASVRRQLGKYSRRRPEPGERRAMWEEAKQLEAEARAVERAMLDGILERADVLLSTLMWDERILARRRFDLVVIDEAAQCTEPEAWVALLLAERAILAGDHCQLPPTLMSEVARKGGLGTSVFERLIPTMPEASTLLTTQYRMNQAIMTFSSREFYEGKLEASASVAEHRLCDLAGVTAGPWTERPLCFLDTAGAGFDEVRESERGSTANPGEARAVEMIVSEWLAAGVPPEGIGVITPYAAQVRQIRSVLGASIEVDTVDGFQGREKEALCISFVRSNMEGEIGFLRELRRTNVALTRARRMLCCVGDSACLAQHPFYQRLVSYFEGLGGLESVWSYPALLS